MSREFIIADSLANEQVAEKCATKLIPVIRGIFKKRLKKNAPSIPKIVIHISKDLPEGKVGSYKIPNENHSEGILTVHPDAFTGEKAPYWYVIAHELIHAFLGPDSEAHKGDFDTLAEEIDIPKKYRD
jgi:predicted metal-dependent hydrolase